MHYLGVDYGRKKVGLALGSRESKLAEPFRVLQVLGVDDAAGKVVALAWQLQITEVIVGLSGREMLVESQRFGDLLKAKGGLTVHYVDENFTTQMAQAKALASGAKRKKRAQMEDAYAATLILQVYLDEL